MSANLKMIRVVETHIDVAGQQMVVMLEAQPGEKKESVVLHIPDWHPEYAAQADDFLGSSPEWGGDGPARPSDLHVWAPIAREWHLPVSALKKLKESQWAGIKKDRMAADAGGFVWDGSCFQSNATSQRSINTNVLLATVNPDFIVDWVLADNSPRTLLATDMVSVGIALGEHLALQFSKSQALRIAIEEADTIDAVRAVCWSVQ